MKLKFYIILLIPLFLISMFGCGDLRKGEAINSNKGSIEYLNQIHNFKLTLPGVWQDKYIIEENENGINFLFKSKKGEHHSLITILFEPEKEWKEFSEGLGGVGPFQEITTEDGIVFVHLFPLENPYDGTDEANEYDKLLEHSWSIVESFRF